MGRKTNQDFPENVNTMKEMSTLLAAMLCLFGGLFPGSALLAADGPPVIQVQTIDALGKTGEYVALVQRVVERQNQVVPGLKTKIYRADLAGGETGLLYVVVEFSSMTAMAEAVTALANDPDWVRLVGEVKQKTGRKILSSSLLTDITPDFGGTK